MLNKLEISQATKYLQVYLYGLIFIIQEEGETRRDLKTSRKKLTQDSGEESCQN